MPYKEEQIKSLIEQYQQRIFALVLYLIGGDHDKAYDIAASSFVEEIRSAPFPEDDGSVLISLAGAAIEKSRNIKNVPSLDEVDFTELPSEKRQTLFITISALQALPFEVRAPILLRDQLHIAYKDICVILRISERDVRMQTARARSRLRDEIKEILERAK